MTQLQQKITLPIAMAEKLEIVRRRTLRVQVCTALVAAVGVLLAAMAVAMLVDWLATIYDFRWRAALTYSAWTAAGATLMVLAVAAWRHTRRVDHVAVKIDREIPELEERWSTVTSLSINGQSKRSRSTEVHPAMFQQVSAEAQSWTPRIESDRVVPLDHLIRALLLLTAVTSILGIAVVFDARRTTVLLRRFWQPFTAISATELTNLPGDLVVGRGESLEIGASLVGAPVKKASLLIEPEQGELKTLTLIPRGDSQDRLTHRLRSIKAPLRYRLRAGDGQTPWYEIVVADRPQLANVRLQLTPPAYTRKEPKVLNKLPRRITVMEGTRIEISLKPKQALQSLRLKLSPDLTEQLTADPQGWYRWETTITQDIAFQPLLTEEHGLGNLRPPTCEIKCRPDKPPVVKILTPNRELAVHPDESIPITFIATDDVGIQQAELIVYDESEIIEGKPRILDTIPVALGEQQGTDKVKATVELDLSKYKTVDGSELSFSIRVREDRGQAKPNIENSVSSSRKQEVDASTTLDDSVDEPMPAEQAASALEKDTKEILSEPQIESNGRVDSNSPNVEPSVSPPVSPENTAKTQAKPAVESPTTVKRPVTPANTAAPEAGKSRKNSQSSITQQSNSPTPNDPLPKRSLDTDLAQSSNSQRMRLKIDAWAGSFEGQQRLKLEIAIAPKLEELDRTLEKAQTLSRSVLDAIDNEKPWTSQHDRDIQRADEQIEAALKVVEALENETYDTPYAFIGLQLVDISQTHIGPARRDFWKSRQTDGAARVDSVRNGWQHTTRARELITLLTERFERTRTELKLADSVEKLKKMYRVFVENSMALLRPEGAGDRYRRKIAEFDLDEEYLKRLEEVLKMRSEMRAELARILAEDPRLLRRFLDAQRNRSKVLRNDLDRLIERQSELNRETRAWTHVEEDRRDQLASLLLERHLESAQDLAIAAAELNDRFETWSPLGKEVEDADFRATSEILQKIATTTRELSADSLRFVDASKRAQKVADATESKEDGAETGKNHVESNETLEQISSDAQQLYERYTQLEVLLRQLGSRQGRPEIAYFATNRLIETRRLVEQTSAWIRQLKQQQAGNYHRSAEVAQYRLAMETDAMAGKLADLESTIAGLLQNEDGMLPQSIAEKARGLLATLDEQAAPNQLAAVYALRRNKMSRATSRQEAAIQALELAGKLYDEMIEASIKELDKLPVQDPIASLLDDPTLDELLRQLEQELPINEALGIPRRPTNLQIISDWLRPGSGNGGMTRMMLNQMRQQQQLRQRQLERAYRRAIARALKESDASDLVKNMPQLALEKADWNRLASQLDDDLRQGRDKAPPERYRRAIEQYFRQVSGSEKGSE
ncbi:MAG: hypothetical protein GXP24_05960 [Planctomycetes bacterium]|nr:hypothetical protein [Planctomycetota bacterium]